MHRKGFFYLAITIFFFSTYEVVSRTMVGAIDPIQLNFLRFFFGGLLLLPLALRDLKKRQLRLSLNDMLLLAMIGIFSVGLSMNLLQFGINLTKATQAAVIFSSNTLFVTLAASLLLRERLSLAKLGDRLRF